MAGDEQKVIFSMVGVRKSHGKQVVLQNISLSFFYGAKIGVLGLNGAGKSSLLRIIAGLDTEHEGELHISDGYRIGMLEQEPRLEKGRTVRQIVEEGASETLELLAEFEKINERFAEPMDGEEMEKLLERQGEVQEKLDAADAWNLDSRLELAMDALRCPPEDQPVDELSGGERRRAALVRLLLRRPDILLLDEPTNHLDAESVAWLEQHLKEYEGTVIAVTHDRYFLDNVAGWILELDQGYGIPFRGNYSSWLEQKEQRLALEEKKESERRKTLQHELEWIRMAPKGRQSKGKARINAYEELLSQDQAERQRELQIFIPPGPRLGDIVIEARGVKKSYGDRILVEDLDLSVPPGAILGIVGPNGAGKTTLFKMIIGEEEPDEGSFTVGDTVVLGHVDQMREALDPQKTVWEAISGGEEEILLGKRSINSRAYVSRFNFQGGEQQKLVGSLSGGERNRVQLAMMLKSGANTLLLDEPTNDLDVNTMRAVEDGLINFAGCVLVISHDRWFLDRIATHILAFEGDSRTFLYPGNYSQYEAQKRTRLGEAAERPHRIKYRKLTRD